MSFPERHGIELKLSFILKGSQLNSLSSVTKRHLFYPGNLSIRLFLLLCEKYILPRTTDIVIPLAELFHRCHISVFL